MYSCKANWFESLLITCSNDNLLCACNNSTNSTASVCDTLPQPQTHKNYYKKAYTILNVNLITFHFTYNSHSSAVHGLASHGGKELVIALNIIINTVM